MVGEGGVKRFRCIGNQENDGMGLVRPQSLGITVNLVVKLVYGIFHADSVRFADRYAVDYLGYGAKGNASLPCHVFHCRIGDFWFHWISLPDDS